MRMALRFLNRIILFGSLLTASGLVSAQQRETTQPSAPVPVIVGAREIIIDRHTGAGSTFIHLRSTGPLGGSLTGVISTAAGPKPKITFKETYGPGAAQAPGKEVLPLTLGSEAITTVVAEVTDANQVGEFDADLAYEGNNFGKVKVIHLPFAVTIDGPDPYKADLSLVDEEITSLTLKNDDPVAYPVIWRLNVGGSEVCGGQLTLPAKSMGLIQCKPSVPFTPSRIQDLFKVESTEGHSLLLYPVLPNTTASFDKSSPWKIIPVKASASHFGAAAQQVLGYVGIVAVLIAGGLTSLLLSQSLPNRLRRLNLRERLMNTARTTSNLTSSIGSRLQVLLRLERSRLYDVLDSRNTFSPDFNGIAARCDEYTAKLEARVALAQQVDIVLERLDQKLTLGPPPSQIAAIEALIDDAKVLLAKTEPSSKDLEAAQLAVVGAAQGVDMLNEVDESFGQSLAKRVLDIQTDIKTNFASNPVFSKLDGVLPGPYKAVLRVPANTTTIVPAQYAELDMAVEKLLLMKEFVVLYEGTQDPQMLDRLDRNLNKLCGYLQLQSWPAMRSARLLMRQMKDDVYADRLRDALHAKAATLVMQPVQAYDRAPLEFCVCFNSHAIEKAAAREEWTCQWEFGDGLNEVGWNASHYFMLPNKNGFQAPAAADFTVRATFRDHEGNVLNDPATNQPLAIEKKVNVRPSLQHKLFGDRAKTELLKLVAALFIAVFALVAGAREQLMKLDILPGLIAVFMVGFGADTIKNLLTKNDTTP
jgi:hypothetical protein